jgi:acetyltransferase-like isoleucine patch superfamily enzyme
MHGKRKFTRYAWVTSQTIAQEKNLSLFARFISLLDILYIGFRYNATTLDYLRLGFHNKKGTQRYEGIQELLRAKAFKDRVDQERIILSKYSAVKYEDHRKWDKRNRVYAKAFNMGAGSWVQQGVYISCTHGAIVSKVEFGKRVLLCRNADIDYTGGLFVGNNVSIAEGVKILTHGHDYFGFRDVYNKDEKNLYLTPLTIRDNVSILTHALIMPGVEEIGENSIVSAASVVTKRVPPNVLVAGNPARVVAKLHNGLKVIKSGARKE